jgi:Dolichyl-phosphate-mannose-protein mannosyltransferase
VTSAPRQPISPATATEWRRRREASAEVLPPPSEAEKPRNVLRVPGYAATLPSHDVDLADFAESQHAGLRMMMGIAQAVAPPQPPSVAKPGVQRSEPRASPPVRATSTAPARPAPSGTRPVVARPGAPLLRIPVAPARLTTTQARESPESAARPKRRRLAHLPGVLPLVVILTVQATLSARLIIQYTAFNDEALYLWAGRVEWSHWFHGTPVPLFQTYFSGAPIIYPPLGALANDIGGLTAARILSLCFMLGATVLLWSTASRLYDRWTASFAAGFWAILGATQHLGAYATYDAMALFLVALAAWCATGRRDQEDATGWILAAAGALALANATKYASAILDPVVIGLAIVSALPHPGGKVALRRGTLLAACVTGTLALLVHLGGPLYLRGIEQTTLSRTANTSPVMMVIDQSWAWVGAVAVVAAAGVILSWRQPCFPLTTLLATAVALVPIEQARIHTTTSLNKHVDFGAWFAVIAAGYAIRRITSLPRSTIVRTGVVCGCVIALFAESQIGVLQARNMLFGYWPNEARLIAALRPLTAGSGNYLSEGQYIPVYYLPKTSWQAWSNTRSVRIPDGKIISVPVGAEGNPAVYQKLIEEHYFSVVLLTFTDTVTLDNDLARYLNGTQGYRIADVIPFGPTRHGDYTVWTYEPDFRHGVG